MRGREEYNYTVLFEPAEEGGYVVKCPALPGLVTEGDTLEEARDHRRGRLDSGQLHGLALKCGTTIPTLPCHCGQSLALSTAGTLPMIASNLLRSRSFNSVTFLYSGTLCTERSK